MRCKWLWLGRAAVVALLVVAGSAGFAQAPQHGPTFADSAKIHGAVYVSYEAYNAPQMWKNYSADETRRDFGYAKKIHVNALRIWASYEYWKMEPAKFEQSFDSPLSIAHENGIRVLISLYENDGKQPTEENMWDTGPRSGTAVQSPGEAIATDSTKWEAPREFVQWFMKKYANDSRLCGIELMNEPNDKTLDFAMAMFKTAASMRGSVPLTVGSARLEQALKFIPLGLNLIEFHQNFPPDLATINRMIEDAMAAGKKYNIPVWLTEWQRIRVGGAGWQGQVAATETHIDYSSLAADIRKYPIGTFFWCLMVKQAYLPGQRKAGTVNGLFWPDGSVWSAKDARAIANDPTLQVEEKPLPEDFMHTGKPPL